jgi:hypothetical protein
MIRSKYVLAVIALRKRIYECLCGLILDRDTERGDPG